MNHALHRLAQQQDLAAPGHERLRLQFGWACVQRVAHLLEEPGVIRCLAALGAYLDGEIDREALAAFAEEASRLANHHAGSRSIDGCGHAAVSATYAVANALAGKALQAADYAAYASVYGQGGYGAVSDLQSFEPEHQWQVECLQSLRHPGAGAATGASPAMRDDA